MEPKYLDNNEIGEIATQLADAIQALTPGRQSVVVDLIREYARECEFNEGDFHDPTEVHQDIFVYVSEALQDLGWTD